MDGLFFPQGKSCRVVTKYTPLFCVLYLLVKATSPEYTLPLEKMLIIFAVGLVSVGIHHRDLN